MIGKRDRGRYGPVAIAHPRIPPPVKSLLAAMKDGREYESIVGLTQQGLDLVPELRCAIAEIEAIRGRKCVCYLANVVQASADMTAIAASDHLPFTEMVEAVPKDCEDVDVLLATPGGSADQVAHFVAALRRRFKTVEFLIPYKAMSAGTLWALSGDEIWMNAGAFLGPIDPQIQTRDGRWVPAQALLSLLEKIQIEGGKAIASGHEPLWTHLQIVNAMDYHQLGNATDASDYNIKMAAEFLNKYKFKTWAKHSSNGASVTPQEREERAADCARMLCSHDRWKLHSHAITREVIEADLRIQIRRPESVTGLERAIRRMWALSCYVFERTPTAKLIISSDYSFVRNIQSSV